MFNHYVWSFLKRAASYATLSFLLCIDRCEMKNVQLLLLFFADNSYLPSHCMLAWNKFSLQRRTFHCTFNFKNLCTTKKRSFRFVFKHKHRRASTGVSRGSRPLPFFCTVQIMSSNYLTYLEETLWKISLNNERIHQKDVSTAFAWSFSTLL